LCHESVIEVLLEFYWRVIGLLECHASVMRVLLECYWSVMRVLLECYESATRPCTCGGVALGDAV
jgi:hypothetical protein